jgi:hypothetical protein
MLLLALAATLSVGAMQDRPSQAEYNAFKRCHGEAFGYYRAGVIIFAGDDAQVARVNAASRPLDEFLIRLDTAVARSGAGLDIGSGYSAYLSAISRWDNWPNRPNARQQWIDSDPLTPQCQTAIKRIADFLDGR